MELATGCYIGSEAFKECRSLATFSVKSGTISTIGDQAFENCVALVAIDTSNVGVLGSGVRHGNCDIILDHFHAVLSSVPPPHATRAPCRA